MHAMAATKIDVIGRAAAHKRLAKFGVWVPMFRTMRVDSGRDGVQVLMCDHRPLAARGYAPVVAVEVIDNRTDRTVDRFNVKE